MKPKILYHYCSLETLSKIIGEVRSGGTSDDGDLSRSFPGVDCYLQMTSYRHLNGPSESLVLYALIRKTLSGSGSISRSAAKSYFDKLLSSTKTFVSCFSEEADSLMMWRSYAHDGKGICIGFDVGVIEDTINEINEKSRGFLKVSLERVRYSDLGGEELNDILGSGGMKEYGGKDFMKDISSGSLLNAAILCWMIKLGDYKDEKEWRIIFSISDEYFKEYLTDMSRWHRKEDGSRSYELVHRFSGNSMSERLLFRLGHGCIKKVILGPKNNVSETELERYLKLHFLDSVVVEKSKKIYC